MKALKLALPLVACLAMALVSFESADAQRGRGGFFGNNGDSLLTLLANKKVQDELNFVDDQAVQVDELQQEFREEMRYMFEDMRNGGGDRQQMFEKMRESMRDLTDDFNKKAEELLIEDQLSRLKQLQNQAKMSRGVERALESEELRDELGISDEQLEAMKEKAEEVREWVNKETAKIREKAQDKILSVLDKEQQDKIKEMIGDRFDFGQPQNNFGRGNGRQGNNGRGNNGRGNNDRRDRSRSDF